MAEVEPNDDPTGANHLLAGVSMATGRVGGRCDTDMFVFELDEAGDVEVELRMTGGVMCSATTPTLDLTLSSSNGTSRIGVGTVPSGGYCPVLSATALPAGTYYLSVTADESERPFDYALVLTR